MTFLAGLQSFGRRIIDQRLSAKRGPVGYYKGNRVRALGQHTRKGGYVLDLANRMPVLKVPDLTGFKLKPYVSHATPYPSEEAILAATQQSQATL